MSIRIIGWYQIVKIIRIYINKVKRPYPNPTKKLSQKTEIRIQIHNHLHFRTTASSPKLKYKLTLYMISNRKFIYFIRVNINIL